MVCQTILVSSSIMTLNVREFTRPPKCVEWTGLSAPAAYPYYFVGEAKNKGNLGPRHHVYAFNYYSSVV